MTLVNAGCRTVGGEDSSGVSSVTVGNTLFVSKTGTDATGARQNFAKHYLTVAAAITAASSGDTIVIYPGTYTENITSKDGVKFYLLENAIINGLVTIGNGTHRIGGMGTFTGNGDHCISITGNGSSDVSLQYHSCTGASGYRAISKTGAGYAEVTYARETLAGSAAGSVAIYTSGASSFHYFGQVVGHVTGSTATDICLFDTGTGAVLLDIDQINRTDSSKRAIYSKAGNHRLYFNYVYGYVQVDGTGITNIGGENSFGSIKCEPAAATVAPVVVSGTTSSVKLMNLKLAVTGATASTVAVYGGAAQTVIFDGTVKSNKLLHSNISIGSGGIFIYDTDMDTGNP